MTTQKRMAPTGRLCRWAVSLWFVFFFHKIRLLRARGVKLEGPTVLVVGHPASFLDALILASALEPAVHCLLPAHLVRGPLAGFLARGMGMVLDDEEGGVSRSRQSAVNLVASGGTLVVFADQNPGLEDSAGSTARTAAALVATLDRELAGRRVAVHPVHLFLPVASAQTEELLIHVDAPLARPVAPGAAADERAEAAALALVIEQRFRANPFQLRSADLEYFRFDLEAVLRASLQEDWASRPDWKQDVEGFVLSGFLSEWVRQTNYLDPGRITALHEALDRYRHLLQQRALRQFEVETAGAFLHSSWRRFLVWAETIFGLPIALYGAVNHLAIGALLFAAGSFKKANPENRITQRTIGGAIVLAGYAVQVSLVAHHWGRATAGYYAPTLPLTGLYVWRYGWLLRHRTRLLLQSIAIALLTSRAKQRRAVLLEELDRAVAPYEAKVGATP